MARIHILADHLVSQIAAGEVVERPASVVKELVENALDAGADEVGIVLEAGGKRLVRVVDDGQGMGRDDALLAFDRHATSKIKSFEELQQVGTLGFRGEALASIAAVSRVELRSAEASGEGHLVRIEGGKIRTAEPVAHPRGTSVEVASLFFNVPARRKFLKAPRTELRRAVEVAQGYALARPEVRFSLGHEGRSLLEVLPAEDTVSGARQRIGQIFGPELAGALAELGPMNLAAGGRIWGFVGDPTTTRGRRYFTFVNRRLLRDRAILATFYRAVREEWRSDEFPALFVFLDISPEDVDVNVHPQKAEVRFRDRALLEHLFDSLGPPAAPLVWQGLGGRRDPGDPRAWPAAGEVGEGHIQADFSSSAPRLAEAVYAPLERRPVPLTGRSGETRAFRLLGQYKGTLILLEGPDGLYLVDQHVAHERILYERFRRQLERADSPSQALLEPILLELGAAEALRLTEMIPELDECGFSLREMSGSTLALQAVPAVLGAGEAEQLLLSLLDERVGESEQPADIRRRLLDALAASLSCRAAIKMHHPLTPEEMEALMAELFAAEQPYACPHGRPIVLKMSDADLEKGFGRR
jgi:DNA mismatch repair protein MutL